MLPWWFHGGVLTAKGRNEQPHGGVTDRVVERCHKAEAAVDRGKTATVRWLIGSSQSGGGQSGGKTREREVDREVKMSGGKPRLHVATNVVAANDRDLAVMSACRKVFQKLQNISADDT
ncbi:hypothetical protein E3N88_22757 [Mikania micrantha]|uniref:Uncharacterized protein n=1 Tax=Mikania micrantha TaxID=192012 RepID=A0A5N6NBC7_9ASTR|nr:hypothetical protein E3N88_22757 [Mikania micrantha]